MILDIIYIIAGLLLILYGANWLTDGASALSLKLAIPPVVVGLTVVSFGTSSPELAVGLTSAIKGSADISVGSIIGSNIFNTLLIIGCTAAISPILVTNNTLKKEIPLVIIASLALLFLISDRWLNGDEIDLLSRADGLILLLFFLIFMSYVFAISKHPQANLEGIENRPIKGVSYIKCILLILIGLAGLIGGGNIFVSGASNIARSFHVSESVIGLTLVAGGTSLPELATSIVAAIKKNPGIAIGNVVGSNLFNIFFVLGITSSVSPLEVTGISTTDILVLTSSSILLFIVTLCYGKRTIKRAEGIIFIMLYLAYVIYLIQSI